MNQTIFPNSIHNAWTKKPNPTLKQIKLDNTPTPQTTSGHLPEKGTLQNTRETSSRFFNTPVTPQSPATLMAQLGDVPMKDPPP